MNELDDLALLREYATQNPENSESAFAELVSRRVDFVYSAALRQVRDPHLAEEITQAVFIILAQKAGEISGKTILTGWFFRTTRFVALAQIRAAAKQSRRTATLEQKFQMQSEFPAAANDALWNQMSPLLDDALAQLGETDRQAVLLRYFENKSLAEVGNFLSLGEDTARKRVARALEKLHRYFNQRGVSSTTAILAGELSANSLQAAPVGLAKTISAAAVLKGSAASLSTLILVKGALKIMAWTKTQMVLVVGVGLLLAAGTTTIAVKQIEEHSGFQWQVQDPDDNLLSHAPPLLKILPTKFPDISTSRGMSDGRDVERIGIGVTVETMIFDAYNFWPDDRAILPALPQEKYDFIDSVPKGANAALQQAIKEKFGFVARRETIETNVFLLVVKNPNAQGLRPSTNESSSYNYTGDIDGLDSSSCSYVGARLSDVASFVEGQLTIPIIDKTGVTNRFDFDLKWQSQKGESKTEAFKQTLFNQLGLELVPTNMPIEMLVVEKAQ